MTFIRSSTDGTTWTTSSITLTPDDANSTSWVSNALNSSSVIQTVYSQDIAAVVTDNGLILRDNISDSTPNFSTVYSGVATTVWTTRTSNFGDTIDNHITSIGYGNGLWIISGQNYKYDTSTDLITWTTLSPPQQSFQDIIYENNIWVAGGGGGVKTSTDGINWVNRISNLGVAIAISLAYGNGLWVLGAQNNQIRRSTDTITWVTVNSNFANTTLTNVKVAYGNGLWVAVGGYGGNLANSTDAITWVTQNPQTTQGTRGIAYGNGLWVMVGQSGVLRNSTDTITWVTQTSNVSVTTESVYFRNNFWILTAQTTIRKSTDTVTWVTQNVNMGNTNTVDIAFGNNNWVVVGNNGQIRTSTNTTIITPGTKIYKGNASNNFLAIDPTIENTIYTSNNLSSFSTNSTLWYSATNGGTTTPRNSIKFANNIFVMVGGSGQIRNSTDGKSWNSVVSNTSNELRHLNYGNGIWMAVGGAGTVRTSTNGTNWTTSNSNFGSTVINAVAYGNGSWLIGGYAGQIRSSTDNGVTWITQTNPFGTSTIGGIAYGNGLWVLGGFNSQIAKSTDLITWTTQVVSAGSLIRRVMYINNTWIVVANLNTPVPGVFSTDATSWTNISFPVTNSFSTPELDYSNGEWLIGLQGNTGLIGRSTNLTNWTIENTFIGQSIGAVAYGNGIFAAIVGSAAPGAVWSNRQFIKPNTILQDINFSRVILGDSGKIAINNSSNQWIVSSTGINDNFIGGSIRPTSIPDTPNTGISWVTQNSYFGDTSINSVAYGNGIWSAAGSTGQLRTSTDTIAWVTQNSNFGNSIIHSIAYGNGLWLAAGAGGTVRTSTDSVTWNAPGHSFGINPLRTAFYGNNLWIVAGDTGVLITSTDAITWTSQNSNFGNTSIRSVAYGNSLWVAVGITGQLRTSTDGVSWTTQTSNFGSTSALSVAYANGLWVATGSTGQLRTSTDGVSWTTQTPNFGNNNIAFISYGNGLWVAGSDIGQLRTSTDAITWTTRTSNFPSSIASAFYGNNLWVAVGAVGQIRTSPPFLNIYEYLIEGNNALYKTTDLTTWTTISSPAPADVNDIIAKN